MKKKKYHFEFKLKQLPIILTLVAAGISCVMSIRQGVDFSVFTQRLVAVVIGFYVLGAILQIFLEKAFKVMEPEEGAESEDAESTAEEEP